MQPLHAPWHSCCSASDGAAYALLQSLLKMGPLQSNFLSCLQTCFVSSLIRTGSNIQLQMQLLTWASFQAQWKQDKRGWGRKSLCPPSGCSSNHHPHLIWERELFLSQDNPMVPPHHAHTAPPTPSAPHPSLLVRSTSSSLQTGVSRPTRPKGWPPSIHLYYLGIH